MLVTQGLLFCLYNSEQLHSSYQLYLGGNVEISVNLVLDVLAILLMVYCLWLVITLRKNVRGGVIGSKWNILTGLVFLFALGYSAMPFFGQIPPEVLRTIISVVFVFGAIYVLITIKLIMNIIKILSQ